MSPILHCCSPSLSNTPRKLDAQRQKEAYERQVKDAERKREIEREKAEKREQELESWHE